MSSGDTASNSPLPIQGADSDLSKEIIIDRTGMVREDMPQGVPIVSSANGSALSSARHKSEQISKILRNIATREFSPTTHKVFSRTFGLKEVEQMVGRTGNNIRRAESGGELPQRERNPSNNRREPYTLEEVNAMRDHFGTRPRRAPTEMPAVIAFQNFKGGCGKSTLAVHGAQSLALKGYRVLMIDCDPQGSASMMFGMNPGLRAYLEPTEEDEPTLSDYLQLETDRFASLIRKSYFPGIDIIPTSLELFNAEYSIAAAMTRSPEVVSLLKDGIHSVWQDYDFVILDPPPALGMLSISVFYAANAMLIPLRPTMTDFQSTGEFCTMLEQNIDALERNGFSVSYQYNLMLVNALDEQKVAEQEISQAISRTFTSDHRCDTMMRSSAEIGSAGKSLETVYDLRGATASSDTYKRCLTWMDKLYTEIETRTRRGWDSHRDALRNEAAL